MKICIIDTSVFLEILNVPRKASQPKQTLAEMKEKAKAGEKFFLPMAVIIETGNHIAQNGDGNQRYEIAKKFVQQVQLAVEGKSPFTIMHFPESDLLNDWLAQFPDSAMRGCGIGDVSIKTDAERMRKQNPNADVYIWSLDKHLACC